MLVPKVEEGSFWHSLTTGIPSHHCPVQSHLPSDLEPLPSLPRCPRHSSMTSIGTNNAATVSTRQLAFSSTMPGIRYFVLSVCLSNWIKDIVRVTMSLFLRHMSTLQLITAPYVWAPFKQQGHESRTARCRSWRVLSAPSDLQRKNITAKGKA